MFVSDKNTVVASGVADPFLNQEQRYHCPIFALFKFKKPKIKTFTRTIWLYEQGNYDELRQKVIETDWTTCFDEDISIHTNNFIDTLRNTMKQCITNKKVTIRPQEPPWLTKEVKTKIRNRKRAYHKAKRTQLIRHWDKFKRIRNETITLIRKSKQQHKDILSEKNK